MADPFRTQQDSYHPTVPRALRDMDVDFSRMDDTNYLQYRNIQLETELHYLREQLAQAHSGTQYVISCFKKAHELSSITSVSRDDPTIRRLRDDHAHSSHRLGIIQTDDEHAYEREQFGNRPSRSNDIHSHPYQHRPAGYHSETSSTPTFKADDLLTFENGECSPTATDLQSPATSFQSDANALPVSVGHSFNTSLTSITSIGSEVPRYLTRPETKAVGLGIRNAGLSQQNEVHPPWDLHREPNYVLKNREAESKSIGLDATLPFETNAAVVQDSAKQWRAIRSPPPSEPELVFDAKFLEGEHNRLLNSACFIEDMTGEERELHWMTLGREKGRHSAREWKLYYENIIRPAYLSRTHKTEATSKTASTNVSPDGIVFAGSGDIGKLADAHVKQMNADSSQLETRVTGLHHISADNDDTDVVLRHSQTSNERTNAPEAPTQDFTQALTDNIDTNKQINLCQGLEHSYKKPLSSTCPPPYQPSAVATSLKTGGYFGVDSTSSPAFSDLKTTIYTPDTNSTSNMASPQPASQAVTPLRRRPPFSSFPTEASHILYSPDVQDSSHFRTTLISDIESGITLTEVVSKIRGGRIVSAKYVETNGMKTVPAMTTNTVILAFLSAEEAAAAFDIRSQEEHSSQAAAQLFNVTVLGTPTRPLHPKLEFDMQSRGLTRVFYIVSEKQEWTPEAAMQEIMHREGRQKRPLVAGTLRDDMLFFEFADVRDAAMAWEVVDRDRSCFRGVRKGFLPDPCSGREEQAEGEKEASSGSDADDEGDGGSAAVDTPEVSFEKRAGDDMAESEDAV